MKEIVLDTETTGISIQEGHRIVEIACLELENLIPTGNKFHCCLNPERKVSEKAFKIHGYSDEFLSKQKKFKEVKKTLILGDMHEIGKTYLIEHERILNSVKKTGRLAVIDSGWSSSGFSSEIITSVVEKLNPEIFKSSPIRIALPDAPAPTSRFLEKNYYFDEKDVVEKIKLLFNS